MEFQSRRWPGSHVLIEPILWSGRIAWGHGVTWGKITNWAPSMRVYFVIPTINIFTIDFISLVAVILTNQRCVIGILGNK